MVFSGGKKMIIREDEDIKKSRQDRLPRAFSLADGCRGISRKQG
jgi:hypothetical protein